ncbi:hypothetical protein B0H10DRAFT_1950966 [Mycena sp. CBHHK59/15]|nr:hypothetical protein B0H10DRAFT_1950966 [Mycena sp. CBHHK59/15]
MSQYGTGHGPKFTRMSAVAIRLYTVYGTANSPNITQTIWIISNCLHMHPGDFNTPVFSNIEIVNDGRRGTPSATKPWYIYIVLGGFAPLKTQFQEVWSNFEGSEVSEKKQDNARNKRRRNRPNSKAALHSLNSTEVYRDLGRSTIEKQQMKVGVKHLVNEMQEME